jgi:hypothetical protein
MAGSSKMHQFSASVSPAFAGWLDGLVERVGRSKADLVEQGLARIAAEAGYAPPPRRAASPGRPRKAVAEASA